MSNIHPSENSYVIDQESATEMARLMEQSYATTRHMGGLFPQDLDLSTVHDILDIASGPGGWALEVAFAHPDKHVVGIDISQAVLDYARTQATVQGLANAHFLFMDATSPLQFPDHSFDVVNARYLMSCMWKEAWTDLVAECVRITRPGGVIRLIETDTMIGVTNSLALEKMNWMVMKACFRTGRSFFPAEDGTHLALTPMLRPFLEQEGCQYIRQIPYIIDYSAHAENHAVTSKNLQMALKLIQPFILKLGIATTAEVDDTYQQAVEDLESDDFRGIAYFTSVHGYTKTSG